MMDVDLEEPTEAHEPEVSTASTEDVLNYIKAVSKSVFAETEGSSLDEAFLIGTDLIKKFVGDPQSKVLLLHQYKKQIDDESDSSEITYTKLYHLRLDEQVVEQGVTSIAYIKKAPVIEEDKSVYSQLRVINLKTHLHLKHFILM